MCGALVGVLLTGRLVVRMADGREVSPTEFEREGGKGSSKKWKVRGCPAPFAAMGRWRPPVALLTVQAYHLTCQSLCTLPDALRLCHSGVAH